MKKISLKNLNLKEVEQLSREQLKNVMGGFSGSDSGKCLCSCDDTEGSWYSENCEGGISWACGTDGSSGTYSCS